MVLSQKSLIGENAMNRNLLILGAGGHGHVVKETAEALNIFDDIDFLDDQSPEAIGRCVDLIENTDSYTFAIPAFGNNELRNKWQTELLKVGFTIPVLIHPASFVSPSAELEAGTVVLAHAVVNTNVKIKAGVIIGIGALIDHDTIVEKFSHINSGAIIKAGMEVEMFSKINAGTIFG